jgi:hypothetical protein
MLAKCLLKIGRQVSACVSVTRGKQPIFSYPFCFEIDPKIWNNFTFTSPEKDFFFIFVM